MPRNRNRRGQTDHTGLRSFIAIRIYEATSEEPSALEMPYETLFRAIQDAANCLVRHALDPIRGLDLPPFVRVPEGLVEEVQERLRERDLPESSLWDYWYDSPDPRAYRLGDRFPRYNREELQEDVELLRSQRLKESLDRLEGRRPNFTTGRSRERRAAGESVSDHNDISWVMQSADSRAEILKNAMFLRGFLDLEELAAAADEYHQRFRRWDRENIAVDPLLFPLTVPSTGSDEELSGYSAEDFQKFVESIVRFQPSAATERITFHDGWKTFLRGIGPHGIDPSQWEDRDNSRHPTAHVRPQMLDGAIAMWVRTLLHVGVTTSSSCSGHYSAEAYIDFASSYDAMLAKWILLDAGVGEDFACSDRLLMDPKKLLSEAHFRFARGIFERKDEFEELRQRVVRRVQVREFECWEPLRDQARERLLDGELARIWETP